MVSRARFIAFYQMNAPRTIWRFAKRSGLIHLRQVLRRSILLPLQLKPLPGDEDYVLDPADLEEEVPVEDAMVTVAMTQQAAIRDMMGELVERGFTGDVVMVAMRLGLVASLDTLDLRNTPTLTALVILRDPAIAKRLGNEGYFDILIEEAVLGIGPVQSISDLEDPSYDHTVDNPYDLIVLDPEPKTFRGRVFKLMRRIALKFATSNVFDGMVLLTILVSSVMLCLDTPDRGIREPVGQKLVHGLTLFIADITCNSIFVVEALAKIFAFGFWVPLSVDYVPYFRSNANRLDLFVLLMALAEMTEIGDYIGTASTKILRLMKVLRPLRLMSRSEGLKDIIIALASSVKPMVYAVVFLTVIVITFTVTAMALFKDKFNYCTDMQLDGSKNEGKMECLGHYLRRDTMESGSGLYMPRSWVQPGPGQNFDTFSSSMLLLFRCLTLKWVQYYASAQDAPYEKDIQPIFGNQMIQASIFFQIFILFGSFFCMNLLVSFMCDAFYSIRGEDQLEEIQWISVQKMVKENWPRRPQPPPSNRFSVAFRSLLASTRYKLFSVICLMANVVFMSTAHAGQAGYYSQILDIQNTVFFGQMCLEALFYFLSVGPVLYVKDRGHQFDMILILATSITMLFQEEMRTLSQGVRILRLFKFGRALSQDRTISNVFETITVSIAQVANIFVVLVVLIMMFSVLSVQLFGSVKYGIRHGSQVKFTDFPNALRSIFQIMFGDEWHQIQDDCMVTEPSCTPDIYDPDDPKVLLFASDCGGLMSASIFFPSLLILGNYVVLNLFVGMIMNNFAYINCKDSNGVLEPEDFIHLSEVWVSKFDHAATGMIKLEDVYALMQEIGQPLGIFGTEENVGRYLCVRQELKQKLKDQEENPTKKGGHLYNWIKDEHEGVYAVALEKWRMHQNSVRDAQQACMHAQAEVNLLEEDQLDESLSDGNADDYPSLATHPNSDHPNHVAQREDDAELFVGGGDELAADLADQDGGSITQISGDGPSVVVEGNNMGQTGAIRQQAWICGSKMGAGRAARLAAARSRLAEARAQLERASKAAKKHSVPSVGFRGKFLGILRKTFEIAAPFHTHASVKPGYVGYSDVVMALLHWNKRRNIVPGYLMEQCKEEDNQVILEVAFQFVQAVILGGVCRRRRRKAKTLANTRLKRAGHDARRMMKALGSTKDLLANKEADKIKAMHDSHAKPDVVRKYLNDPSSVPSRVMCAKIAIYGIAVGHELAGLALEAGHTVEKYGIFGLSDDDICDAMMHPTMIAYSEHVKAIDTLKFLVENGQLPLMMLASHVHKVEWIEDVQKMPKSDLMTLLSDPNVQTVISNLESSTTNGKDAKKRRMLATELVPGGPGSHEAAMLLDDHILEELAEVREKIKAQEAENEKLNQTLEATQTRMFELRTEHDALVEAATSARKAAKNPSRVRRYDPGAAVSTTCRSQAQAPALLPQARARQQSNSLEQGSHGPSDAGALQEDVDILVERDDDVSRDHSASRVNTMEAAPAQAGTRNAAPVEQEHAAPVINDPRKIQEQIELKKAEMHRLQMQIDKVRRQTAGGDQIANEVRRVSCAPSLLARASRHSLLEIASPCTRDSIPLPLTPTWVHRTKKPCRRRLNGHENEGKARPVRRLRARVLAVP